MSNLKATRLRKVLFDLSAGLAPPMYPSLANLGRAGSNSASQELMAAAQQEAEKEAEKKRKGGLGATVGSALGVLAAPLTGGTSLLATAGMGALGGAAGGLIGSGGDTSDLLSYAGKGAAEGVTQAAAETAGMAPAQVAEQAGTTMPARTVEQLQPVSTAGKSVAQMGSEGAAGAAKPGWLDTVKQQFTNYVRGTGLMGGALNPMVPSTVRVQRDPVTGELMY
jgi:hypothetical protein